jgi:hypothetical protein
MLKMIMKIDYFKELFLIGNRLYSKYNKC